MLPQFGNPGLANAALLMGQLGSPLQGGQQLFGQPGSLPPAALLQLLALQNQTMAQSMRPTAQLGVPSTAMSAAGLTRPLSAASSVQLGAAQPHPQPSLAQQGQQAGTGEAPGPGLAAALSPNTSGTGVGPSVSGRKPLLMYTDLDEGRLTPYQVSLCAEGHADSGIGID